MWSVFDTVWLVSPLLLLVDGWRFRSDDLTGSSAHREETELLTFVARVCKLKNRPRLGSRCSRC